MLSESGSFCFMGVSSKPSVFLSDNKDPKGNTDPECLRVRPVDNETHINEEDHQCQFIRPKQFEERDHQAEEQNQRDHKIVASSSVLPLALTTMENIPSSHVGKELGGTTENVDGDAYDSDNDDGFKTPTSSEHRIPAILECPGAPKKTRITTRSPKSKKRKSPACRRRLVFDLAARELESLFPTTPFMVDDVAGDKKNKKAKRTKTC